MKSDFIQSIHLRAVEVSNRYKKMEVELIEVLQEVEKHRVFLKRGHASLFAYVTSELGLGESVAYGLITVARKACEVPELKVQLQAGAMSFSNARRVVSVLTAENKDEWLKKASEMSNRELEKEIVRVRPQEATPERMSYVTPERVKLEMGLSENALTRLKCAQDLLSQSRQRSVSLEETVEALTEEFLKKNDPVEKAKRAKVAALEKPNVLGDQLVTLRVPIPASVRHQVNRRDQRRCVYKLPNGSRCNQSRWVEIHHKIPVSEGGTNVVENLVTLCSSHHRFMHLRE